MNPNAAPVEALPAIVPIPTKSDLQSLINSIEGKTVEVESFAAPCNYTEYDGESGETMRCTKPMHSGKIRHGNWVKV